MRRRRQKNPLLLRIIGISVAVNVVALMILAHFGGFKKLQEHFVETKIVVLPPPERPKLEQQKIKAQPKKAPQLAHRGNTSHHGPARANPNQVHIQLAQGPGAENGEPGAQQGTLQPGQVPQDTAKAVTPNSNSTTAVTTPKETNTTVVTPTAPPVTRTETAVIKPVTPIVTPPPPHVPVFTEAVPVAGRQPQPSIPDEFRSDSLDTTVIVDVTVGTDGSPTDAVIAQSTGKRELDRIATDAARQWRFTPATKDGEPVVSHVRLHIEFQVS